MRKMSALIRFVSACILFCFLTASSTIPDGGGKRGRQRGRYPPVCPDISKTENKQIFTLPDIFSEDWVEKEGSYNVFFVESSCVTLLHPRIWCALESVAHHNPEANIWLVMISTILEKDAYFNTVLSRYPNIHMVTAHPAKVLEHTPLHAIYTSQSWRENTSWPEINLGDLVRLGLVWEFGGLYLDSDIVCLRPLSKLINTMAWQDRVTFGSGAFHFTPSHPVLSRIMDIASHIFKADVWGASGPQAFTRAVHEHCGDLLAGKQKHTRCKNLTLLPITSFYPVPAGVWKTIFKSQRPRSVAKRYPNSYTLHTWRQLSHNYPVTKDSGAIYDMAALEFCPYTRGLATRNSNTY